MFFSSRPTQGVLDAISTLAQISSEAWIQSRAALYLANGATTAEAAEGARRDFEVRFGGKGLHVTHFDLALPKRP